MVKKCFDPELARSNGLADNRFPETIDEAEIVEDVLAKELDKLSLDEHEKILFDVHGIAQNHDEDPDKIEESLKCLEEEIQKINEKEVYLEAKSTNPDYVSNRSFRLMFLRSEKYDPKVAAEVIVEHFYVKKLLFGGGEVLARSVRMDDLDQETQEVLGSGFSQILPKKDAAGRTVLVLCPTYAQKYSKNDLVSPLSKACFYFNMEVLKDEEAQIKGFVMVMYNYSNYIEKVDFMQNVHSLRGAIPQRMDAAHYCYNSAILRPFVAGIRLFIDADARFRLRPHYGTPQSIEFELQTFGIPAEDSPMSHDGTWSTQRHQEWIAALRLRDENQRENTLQQSSTTCSPRRFDVLFGKSKEAREHTGNLRALHLCDMHWSKYEQSSKYGKTEVAEKIVSIIQESNGRFLKSEKGVWVEVSDDVAREKVSHFFRHMRAKMISRRSSSISASEESTSTPSLASEESDFFEGAGLSPPMGGSAKRISSTGKDLPAKRVTPCPSPSLLSVSS